MQPDGIEPASGAPCRACGKKLPEGRLVCPACGAAHGEANRCPHCHGVADVEPHPSLGFRCRICGGPRVPLDAAGVVMGPATKAALERARREQAQQLVASAAGWALAGAGALVTLVAAIALLAASPGMLVTLAILLGCGLPLAAGAAALGRAAGARSRRNQALREAQVSALGDIQAVTGVLDAERAAELLRTDPERAELLLAEASVGALLGDAPAPRTRVAVTEPGSAVLDPAVTEAEAPAGPQRTEH